MSNKAAPKSNAAASADEDVNHDIALGSKWQDCGVKLDKKILQVRDFVALC